MRARTLEHVEGHTFFAPESARPAVVLDLGANYGRFSHALLQRFDCRCYAVEANPQVAKLISPHPRLSVFNYAIADRDGTLPFHVSWNSEMSSLLIGSADRTGETINVPAVSLDSFRRLAGVTHVDLIKVDIEGAEVALLDSCSDDFLKTVPQITVEFHDFLGLTPLESIGRINHRLESLGFYVIKVWRHAWGDTLYVNRRWAGASKTNLDWARYLTRNWWGVKRVVQRWSSGRNGEVARPSAPDQSPPA